MPRDVFFTDQPNDRIVQWSTEGKLETWMSPAGRSNGMFFDLQGNLIACADEKNELWKNQIRQDARSHRGWLRRKIVQAARMMFG